MAVMIEKRNQESSITFIVNFIFRGNKYILLLINVKNKSKSISLLWYSTSKIYTFLKENQNHYIFISW